MEANNEQQYINSISRAISILNLFNENRAYIGITEISNMLNIHKTTVFRIVKTLEHEGWLDKDEKNNLYKLGFNILQLASNVSTNYENREIILDEMKKLEEEFNEDVLLTFYNNLNAVCIEKIESQNMIKITSEIGVGAPLHCGASGKILLAYQSENILKRVIEAGLKRYTSRTITDETLLRDNLFNIKNEGFVVSSEELDEGITGIAVPIFNSKKEILFGLTITGPCNRIEQKGINKIKEKLITVSQSINNQIAILEKLSK